jgi:hypothetical protein
LCKLESVWVIVRMWPRHPFRKLLEVFLKKFKKTYRLTVSFNFVWALESVRIFWALFLSFNFVGSRALT